MTMIARRRFRDAGTATIHEKGEEVNGKPELLANYQAAGLIGPKEEPASEAETADETAPSRRRSSSADKAA